MVARWSSCGCRGKHRVKTRRVNQPMVARWCLSTETLVQWFASQNFNILADDWTVARRKCLVPITKYDFSYARHWHIAVDITIVRVSYDANHRTRISVDEHHRATIGWFTRRVFVRCFPRHPHDDHRATIGWFTRRVFARCFPRHPHDDHRAMHHRPAVSKCLWITAFVLTERHTIFISTIRNRSHHQIPLIELSRYASRLLAIWLVFLRQLRILPDEKKITWVEISA